MWTLAFGHHEDRPPTHSCAATREESNDGVLPALFHEWRFPDLIDEIVKPRLKQSVRQLFGGDSTCQRTNSWEVRKRWKIGFYIIGVTGMRDLRGGGRVSIV